MNKRRTRLINMGKAIELADERTVCAAITQEFIYTSAVAGRWIDERNNEEERYFQIEREQDYSSSLKNQKKGKVDIFLRKFIRNSKNGELVPVEKPSFIEAKRARIWTVKNFSTGEVKRATNNQARAVRNDIKKLRNEMKVRPQDDPVHCHILVWGIYNHGNRSTGDHPLDFFDDVDDRNVELHQVRWLPIRWKNPSHQEILSREKHAPNVTRSLWVALAQVFEEN